MAKFSIGFNAEKTLSSIARITKKLQHEAFMRAVSTAFEKNALILSGSIVKNFLSGNPIRRRTGNLARSVEAVYEMSSGLPRLRVGVFRSPAVKYARILEYGGDILPKRAKALAFPVGNRAVTPAGVSKFDSPRNYPGTLSYIPIRNPKGNAVALLVDSRDLQMKTMSATYLLLRKVSIKPRPFLRPGVMAYLPTLTREISVEIRRIFATGK